MINQKMYELGTKKSTIRTIFEFGRKRAAEVGEENVYDFSLGNPNVPTPAFVKDAAIDILTNMEPSAIHGYTVAPGNPAAREALAKSVNKRFGTHFAGKNFFLTAGAAAAITICFRALSQPEDEFITFAPFFPEYQAFVESVGSRLVVVPAQPKDWQIDFAAFEQRMVTEDKDGICCQRVSLDDVLPGEEQLRRIEAIADPYAMQPQSIMEEQESRRELYDGLKRLTQREQTYLLYRYGFTDGEEHPLIGTAIYFHLTKGRAKKTEEQAMDNLWLELPWWFI